LGLCVYLASSGLLWKVPRRWGLSCVELDGCPQLVISSVVKEDSRAGSQAVKHRIVDSSSGKLSVIVVFGGCTRASFGVKPWGRSNVDQLQGGMLA